MYMYIYLLSSHLLSKNVKIRMHKTNFAYDLRESWSDIKGGT
jgi:hypothetical protein